MVAVLGSEIEEIEKIIKEKENDYKCYIANDNSNGQIVVSGNIKDIDSFILDLKAKVLKI